MSCNPLYCPHIGPSSGTSAAGTGTSATLPGSLSLISTMSDTADMVTSAATGGSGIPSISTTPKASEDAKEGSTSHHKGPLILSSSLPPVPAKLVEKIQRGQFVDFKELLVDNVTLLQRLGELGPSQMSHPLIVNSKLREIQDPLSWVSCFLAFMATRCQDQEMRELAAYGQIVLHLARKHGGKGWLSYDKLFRQQKAAGASMSWAELNPSLMAATVLGNSGEPGRVCSLCMASDHVSHECALASMEAQSKPPTPRQTTRAYSRPRSHPYSFRAPPGTPEEPCRKFNRGFCNLINCKFEHCCSACPARGPHPAIECPVKNGSRPRQGGIMGHRPSGEPATPIP